jgi:putative restriction endonuclease
MCGKIDCSIEAFSKLRTDKNKNRWSPATTFRAPHKPFLLLSILDHISEGLITREFIEPTFELAETFNGYWQRVMELGSSGNMAYPFFHMESEPFWKLVPKPGVKQPVGKTISSMKRIKELYLGAKRDPELFKLCLMEPLRKRLQTALITTYFSPETQFILFEQSQINIRAGDYSKALLETAEPVAEFAVKDKSKETEKKIRDQGFRKAVVSLYKHRCALCGIRMLTPEGHTVVEAAHIVPWRETKDDRPINGLALCRLCHWSFDEGLMAVGNDYQVLISKRVKNEPNFPGHMLTLSDRTIFRPTKKSFWPGQENIEWHRKEVFKR